MPQSAVNFRSGFIGISKIATQLEDESKIKRGFFEKLLIGLVVLAVISILPVKVLRENQSISDNDLFVITSYSIHYTKLYEYVYRCLSIQIRSKSMPPSAAAHP